jgi:hypothetical protein
MSDTLLRHLRRDWLELPLTAAEYEKLKESFRNAHPPLQRPRAPHYGGMIVYETLEALAAKLLTRR